MQGNLGGQLEGSFARSIDSLSACGTSTVLLFLLLVLALAMIVYLTRRNTETVNMVLKALVGGDHGEPDKKGD